MSTLLPIGLLSGPSGSNIDLVGEAFGHALSTEFTVIVGHCLLFFTDPKESIRSFADFLDRG